MTLRNARYTAQSDGTPVAGNSYVGQYGPSHSTINNRGTIRTGGTIVGTKFKSTNNGDTGTRQTLTVFDTTGLAGERQRSVKANSSGTFALMAVGKYIIRRVTTTLAGVANTVLQTGASDFGRRSIHSVVQLRTSFLTSLSWAHGTDLPTYTAVYSNQSTNLNYGQNSTATNPVSQGTADSAAGPTAAVPGTLVYKSAGKLAIQDVYKPKNLQG